MLGSRKILYRRLDGGKIRVVGHDGLGEGGELAPLLAELVDLPHDLFDGSLPAIEHRADLDRRSFDDLHRKPLAAKWWRVAH
jgi:hypothetical protein